MKRLVIAVVLCATACTDPVAPPARVCTRTDTVTTFLYGPDTVTVGPKSGGIYWYTIKREVPCK